jgi:hypothetical protein
MLSIALEAVCEGHSFNHGAADCIRGLEQFIFFLIGGMRSPELR